MFEQFGNICEHILTSEEKPFNPSSTKSIWLKFTVKGKHQSMKFSSLLHMLSSKNQSVGCVTGIVISMDELLDYLNNDRRNSQQGTIDGDNSLETFSNQIHSSNISLVVSLTSQNEIAIYEESSFKFQGTHEQLFQKILNFSDYFIKLVDIDLNPSPTNVETFVTKIYKQLGMTVAVCNQIEATFPSLKTVLGVRVSWNHRHYSRHCDTIESVSDRDVWDAVHSVVYINKMKVVEMNFLTRENIQEVFYGRWSLVPGPNLDDERAYISTDDGNPTNYLLFKD